MVFPKIPNKSRPVYKRENQPEKVIFGPYVAHPARERRGAILSFARKGQPPQTHVAEAGCNLSRSSWYLAKISVREPCALQKNNKHVIQHSKARASCIDQQSEKTYSSSITRAYLNVVLRSQRKQTKLKRALKSKSVSSEWFLFFSPFFIIVSLSSHFRVAMINYEHIPTVFHFPCMNYRQS